MKACVHVPSSKQMLFLIKLASFKPDLLKQCILFTIYLSSMTSERKNKVSRK